MEHSLCCSAQPTPRGQRTSFTFQWRASSKVLGYAPLWVADKKNFFGREGLSVEVTFMRGTSPSLRALAAQSIHAALAGNDGVVALVEKGIEDLAIIAGDSKSTHVIIGKNHIKKHEDLRGAMICASPLTSGTAFLLRRVLKAKGLEYPKDYSLVDVRRQRSRANRNRFGKCSGGDSQRAVKFPSTTTGT